MYNIPRYSVRSQLVCCELCGKEVYMRGLKPHMRLKHGLASPEMTRIQNPPQIKPLENYPLTQVSDYVTQVNDNLTQVRTSVPEVRKVILDYKKPCPGCGEPTPSRELSWVRNINNSGRDSEIKQCNKCNWELVEENKKKYGYSWY